MSGKYVPPAMRNKKNSGEESKVKIPSQDEFPSLGSGKSKSSFKPIRSFAALATEWNEHAEEEKVRKETREMMDRREAERREADTRHVFVYRQREVEYNSYVEEYDSYQSKSEDPDDWTTIEKKARRDLTPEELLEKKLRMEEEERRLAEDSVWNESNGDEWDYRDRRAYS